MLNEMILQGRLTAAPELKSTQSGVFWCDFTVAWNRKYKENEDVCFLTCRAWRERAEFVTKYFSKGDPIAVVGKLITKKWQDMNGQNRSMLICNVDEVSFCGLRANQGAAQTPGNSADTLQFELIEDEGELPF